jgi:hypothetical protein
MKTTDHIIRNGTCVDTHRGDELEGKDLIPFLEYINAHSLPDRTILDKWCNWFRKVDVPFIVILNGTMRGAGPDGPQDFPRLQLWKEGVR